MLFSSSSSNPRLSGGRGVSHNGNYTAHPLSIYFTSGLPPPSHSISSLGFTRHASHRLLSEVTDCKIWGLYFQCSSCTPSSTPKSAVLQGCEGGKLVSLEREPICGFIPSPCLRDWADQPWTKAGVAKHELWLLQIIQIISSKPLLDKKTEPREGDILAGTQSSRGRGLAPVVCTEPLVWVDWCRSTCM